MRDRHGLAKVGNFGGVNGRLFAGDRLYFIVIIGDCII